MGIEPSLLFIFAKIITLIVTAVQSSDSKIDPLSYYLKNTTQTTIKSLCTPKNLTGSVKLDIWVTDYKLAENNNKKLNIITGGKHIPECLYDSKVAIIVPLRNRDSQMVTFLNHMHPILHRQNIYYQIFGIVQSEKGEFNRGKLFNVGFMEALLLENFDCFILHDVDFLLLNDHLKYLCDDSPSHFGTAASQFNYALPFHGYFGGVVALSKTHYIETNGFSNCYWGYGKEEDDLLQRITAIGYHAHRQIKERALYYSNPINHYRIINPILYKKNERRLKYTRNKYSYDGINSLQYEVINSTFFSLYTRITVDLKTKEYCDQIYDEL